MFTPSDLPRIFIGYDPREAVAFYTMTQSIYSRASVPVSITPLIRSALIQVHDRPYERFQSNDFTFTRWLVPYLCGYQGWAIFMDCDMLVQEDVACLWALRDERYAVQVVKHAYTPPETTKYLGNEQDAYDKKNWSSVMLLNCAACTALTPRYVNTASRLNLHQFSWLGNDALIGELPKTWNHLVGYEKQRPDAALIHFTIGGPYFDEFASVEHAETWRREWRQMNHCMQLGKGK